ncbi:MAG: hypothetical protein ATN35_04720 [Epulopiscium sp. Nele67-Bin004]|nr:MAG: hypothetical protein ATN35_04720 [Epulopiscium sp. Nele67-Bin004]
MIRFLYVLMTIFLVGCGFDFDNVVLSDEEIVLEEEIKTTSVLSLSTGTNKKDDELILSMNTPQTLHPIYNTDETVFQILHLVFDTLVNVEPDGSVSKNIAEYWTINDDNSITMVLRSDIFWHDGEPLEADDVVFSIQTIKYAKSSIYSSNVANIAYSTVLSPNTVQIYYNQPFSGMLQTLFIPIIPEHIYNVPYAQAINLDPVGSGAYKFSEHVPLKSLHLEANANYFKGSPNIDKVEILMTPDHEATLSAFSQDLIDVIYTEVMDWGKYAKDKSATIYEIPTQKYEFIGVNFNDEILSKRGVREALISSIDRENLIDIYYLGQGSVADTPISANSYLLDSTLESIKYDKENARLLLAKEGFEYDETLTFSLLVNKDNAERLRVAQGIVQMYDQVGIRLVLEEVDVTTYMDRIYSGDYQLFLGGWKLSYIPDLTFAFHSSQRYRGDNFINYNSDEMDTLLEEAFIAHPNDITTAYSNLQQFFISEVPYISLYFKNGALITKNRVSGDIDPDPLNIFSNIQNWKLD